MEAEEGGSSDVAPNCGLPESVLLLPPPAPGRPTEVLCWSATLDPGGMLVYCMQDAGLPHRIVEFDQGM